MHSTSFLLSVGRGSPPGACVLHLSKVDARSPLSYSLTVVQPAGDESAIIINLFLFVSLWISLVTNAKAVGSDTRFCIFSKSLDKSEFKLYIISFMFKLHWHFSLDRLGCYQYLYQKMRSPPRNYPALSPSTCIYWTEVFKMCLQGLAVQELCPHIVSILQVGHLSSFNCRFLQ